jgi:hypothetical protein
MFKQLVVSVEESNSKRILLAFSFWDSDGSAARSFFDQQFYNFKLPHPTCLVKRVLMRTLTEALRTFL